MTDIVVWHRADLRTVDNAALAAVAVSQGAVGPAGATALLVLESGAGPDR